VSVNELRQNMAFVVIGSPVQRMSGVGMNVLLIPRITQAFNAVNWGISCHCDFLYVVMSCMRVCRKQALSRVKYYYYTTISKIQQATILTV